MQTEPLSTPLSQVLVAFTIEFDNEFERRFAEAGIGRRFGASMVMWSNLMRFVGDGVAVRTLLAEAGLPKARVLSMLGGMERWRYLHLGAMGRPSSRKRDGYGSARGIRPDWTVRPTPAGVVAQEIWGALFADIERRWEERFGRDDVRRLRSLASASTAELATELPEYLPIVGSANGMAAEIVSRERTGVAGSDDAHLPALLARALLAYTLDFERESAVSLPLTANFVRVLDATGVDLRALPQLAGVSKEATSMAVRYLTKVGLAVAEPRPGDARTRLVRLTSEGLRAQKAAPLVHASVERAWNERVGPGAVHALRAALLELLGRRDGDQPLIALGLHPHAGGWRATRPYLEQTNAVIADPSGRLPHYPMVLHRGGWPDGS